jgi:6-phosphogluconolactonase (cycloisomerase 2 family)
MMPSYVYVAAQDDNQIAVFTIDGATGRLTRTAEVPMPGGPSLLAIHPHRHSLYVGHRQVPEISSYHIDPTTGALRRTGSVSLPDPPGFLATDRRGRYLLAAYYQGSRVAVHPLTEDGTITAPPSAWVSTAVGAHAIQTDPSNRFAFVPHIARLGLQPQVPSCRALTSNTSVTQSNRHVSVHSTRHDPDMPSFSFSGQLLWKRRSTCSNTPL